jgi:hypothetical protein
MRTNTTPTSRRATAAIILAGTVALAACAGGDTHDAADFATDAPAASELAGAADDSGDAGFIGAGESIEGDGGFDIGVVGRDVIVEMRVVLSSDDIQRTVAAIMADAAALGGGVASSDVNYGSDADDEQGYAVLVVKVPPQSIDRLLAGLDDTGTVQSINQGAQDVTEQLVDLDVRISNARQSVANVREFMDRTENLNELVTLESELTRRQTELERLEAQQRNLSDRVALATMTVEVVPTAAVPVAEPDEGIADAFRTGWDAFAAFFFGLAFVLAVVLPFLALAAVLLGAAWMILGRLGRHGHAAPATGVRSDDVPTDDESDISDKLVTASHED